MPTLPATPTPATQRSILLLSFATFTSMASQRICDAMLPELSRGFAVSLAQAAQVISVFAVVYGVLQLVYGPLGDRLGKYRVIAWATLGCSVGSGAAVFATSLDLLLLSRVMVALGAAAIIPLTLAWVGDTAPAGQLQETIARVGLGTALGVGSGPLVGGILTDTLGWRWAFGVLAVLYGVVGLLLLADLRRQQQRAALQPGAAAGSSASHPRPGFARQACAILASPWSRTVLVVGLVEGAAAFGVLAIWASHLHGALGFSISAAGAIVALFGAGGVLYMASARQVIRRLRQPELVLLGTGLVFVSALVIAFTPWRWLTLPASLVAGCGFFGFHNVMQANAAQMAPAARGTAVSLFAAALFTGQSVGVLLAASLAERVGAGRVIALGGGALMLLGWAFSRALRRRAGVGAVSQGGETKKQPRP